MKTLRVTSAEAGRSAVSPNTNSELEKSLPPLPPLPPQPQGQGKLLELTPLWEQVTRTGQLPIDVDPAMVFAELSSRLRDPEWEVRQHGLRVLSDIAPVLGARRLDRCLPAVMSELTANLGHPSAAVRKGASDTLRKCVRESSNPDNVLRAVIARSNSDDRNISMGVVIHVPMLLDERISHQTLAVIIGALAKKLIQVSFQEHALKSLVRIRDMVGEKEFSKFLEKYHPQCKQDFDILCQVYEIGECLSDSGIDLQYPGPQIGWCEDIPDIFEPARRARHDDDSSSPEEAQSSRMSRAGPSSSSSSRSCTRDDDSSGCDEGRGSCRPQTSRASSRCTSRPTSSRPTSSRPTSGRPQSGRVVLETEIKFNEQTAITMTILEEEEEERRSASETRTPVADEEDDGMFIRGSNSTPATPRRARRVTFGGEEVLKTPPPSAKSQQTSSTAEILHVGEDKLEVITQNNAQVENSNEKDVNKQQNHEKGAIKQSLIPVRIPTEGGPQIKPVKPLLRLVEPRNKPMMASRPVSAYEKRPASGYEKHLVVESPDLIRELVNKPDILITEPKSPEPQIVQSPEPTESTSLEVPVTSPPVPAIKPRSDSPPVPALSAAMARASSPLPLVGPDPSIPTFEGGESLTGSSPEPEEQGPNTAAEEARVVSALASLDELQEKSTVAAASWEDLAIVDASVMEDLRDRVSSLPLFRGQGDTEGMVYVNTQNQDAH